MNLNILEKFSIINYYSMKLQINLQFKHEVLIPSMSECPLLQDNFERKGGRRELSLVQ